MAAGILAWILAWSLFAFGAVYDWSLVPAIVGLTALAIIHRPAIASPGTRVLDISLLALIALAGAQLIPLPIALRHAISPGTADFSARIGLTGAPADAWAPLSLVPGAWLRGGATLFAGVLCFWLSREAARERGVRLLARAIAWMGMGASGLAIVQPALLPGGMYGFWKPQSPMAHPAGPIVSRNHFASWLILALPVAMGYLCAHVRTHWTNRSRRVQVLADGRALWLIGSGILMTAGLFYTQSRAGTIGFFAAVTFGTIRMWNRLGIGGRLAALVYGIVVGVAVVVWANLGGLLDRFDQVLGGNGGDWGGRREIWRETLLLIHRFWPVGVGLGAFDVVMAVYQTATHSVLFNHAHDQYLHLLAEGGVMLAVPGAIAVAAFAWLAGQRLRQDRTPLLYVREGAVAGLVGLAVQSIWETPLLTPAVLFLAAAVAGLAVYSTGHESHRAEARV
jgi:O-antigen ligase